MKFLTATLTVEVSDNLSEQRYDELFDMHADTISGWLDMILERVGKELQKEYGQHLPALRVEVDVD